MKINSIGANYAGNYAQKEIAKNKQTKLNFTAPKIDNGLENDTVSFKGGAPNYPRRFRDLMGLGGTAVSMGVSALVNDVPFLQVGVPASVVIGALCFLVGNYLGIDLENKIEDLTDSKVDMKKVTEETIEEIVDEDEEIKDRS